MISRDHRFTNEQIVHRVNVRNVYKTTEGKKEFLRMLDDFGLFRQIEEHELPLRNYGVEKLEEMGFLDIELLEEFVDWLFTRPAAYRPTIEEMGLKLYTDPM